MKRILGKLEEKECPQDNIDNASAMLVSSFEDTPLHVCSAQICVSMKMFETVDNRFAPKGIATQI